MKQETNPRRGRSRNTGKRNPNQNQNSRSRNYENSGSENKVRGSSQQILDKYLALARDASLAGDRIAAEGYHQYAEHYFRLLNPEPGTEGGNNSNKHNRKPRYENQHNQQEETAAQPIQQPQSQPQQNEPLEVHEANAFPVESVIEPVAEPVAEPAVEQAVSNEEVVEVKPRRRGRPRKVEASEPAA